MSLKTILLQQVISGFVQSGIVHNLVDDDIALVETVIKYAETRAPLLSFAEAKLKALNESIVRGLGNDLGMTGATGPVGVAGTTGPAALSTVAPQTGPGSTEEQTALPLGTMDRGPDPQDASTLLSTEAPLGVNQDPAMPDYTKLSDVKG